MLVPEQKIPASEEAGYSGGLATRFAQGNLLRVQSHMQNRTIKRGALIFLALTALAASGQAAEKIVWKSIPDAILQIDERAVKTWNLYQAGKKIDPLLLQLGTRSLVIYVRHEQVYEIKPEQLQRKGEDLVWRDSDKPAKPLATSEWSSRDIGSAIRIRVKLTDEGRSIDIQIPIIPDLRRGIY
jgi:hypothetical protein